MKSGTIKLYTGGRIKRIVDKKYYCSVADRQLITAVWESDYDKRYSEMFVQIAPNFDHEDARRSEAYFNNGRIPDRRCPKEHFK